MADDQEIRVDDEGCSFAKKVFSCMFLKKKMQFDEDIGLFRYLRTSDMFFLTVGVLLESFYDGLPRIISTYGYMIFFPILLSGMMSFITSICFAELVALNPNSGGCYRYVYYTMGELLAFLVGWSSIYTSFLRIIDRSEMITKMLNSYILDGAVSNLTSQYLEIGGFDNYFLRIFPNAKPENIIFLLALTGCCVLGVSYKIFIKNTIAFFNLLIIFFCITTFWFLMDLSKFQILEATEDFKFFTEGSVESHLFYADFQVSTYAGAETINPTIAIPRGLVEAFHVGFTIYTVSIILYSPRTNTAKGSVTDPDMKNALWNLGFKYLCELPPIGLMLCYCLSAAAEMFEGTRVMYTMAKDGLFFSIFGQMNQHVKCPVNNYIFIGVICSLVSVFIGVAPSTKWSMIALETITRIMVLISYLITRYRCESDDLSAEENEKTHIKRWVLANYPHSLLSPTKTTQTISILLIFLTVISLLLSELIMIYFIIRVDNRQNYLRIFFVTCLLIAFISIQLLNQQPVNDRRLFLYQLRGVPYTPILAIAWYVMILMLLPGNIWIKITSWLILGLLFYFSFGCMRSVEYRNRKQAAVEIETVQSSVTTITSKK